MIKIERGDELQRKQEVYSKHLRHIEYGMMKI